MRPTTYDVHLEPALATGAFRGRVRIALRTGRSERTLTLHAAELTIGDARVLLAHAVLEATVEIDPKDETVTLRTTEPIPAGEAVCEIAFSGRMNPHLRGLYGVRC